MILSSTIMGNGPALIILHGLFGDSTNWRSIAKELASKFELHLIDQRNHGNSFHHSDHNYPVLAKDLQNYIKEKRINNFSIIGHSMGGKVAMHFAYLYPKNIDKLIIVDIVPKNYNENHFHIFKGLRNVTLSASSRQEARLILGNYIHESMIINFLLKGLYFSKENKAKFKFNFNALEKNIRNILSFKIKKANFNNIVYFLSGDQSDYIQDSDSAYIARLFSLYKVIKINDAGHWVHFDQKERFLHCINKILK